MKLADIDADHHHHHHFPLVPCTVVRRKRTQRKTDGAIRYGHTATATYIQAYIQAAGRQAGHLLMQAVEMSFAMAGASAKRAGFSRDRSIEGALSAS